MLEIDIVASRAEVEGSEAKLKGASQMLAKSNKPYFFTEWQAQRLKGTTHSLRKLNRDSMLELQRLKLPGLTNTKYRTAGNSFEILAPQVTFLLRFREAILSSAREQRVGTLIVHIRFMCNDCRLSESQRAKPAIPPPDHSRDALKQDPAHLAEVDTLLELAQETGERLSARLMLPTTRRVVMAGLQRLMDALLKQRRHLQDTLDRPEGLIEVITDGAACTDCQKPREIVDPFKEEQRLHEHLK